MRRRLEDFGGEFRRGTCISIPGLVTGGFLDQLALNGNGPAPSAFELPTHTVTANGTPLHYFEFGSGPPIVFVHGSLGDYRTWGNLFEPLAADYRLVSYSRRYHYPNAWHGDGSDYCTELHTADLAAFVRGLQLGPVHLVGQSTGATIAARCASQYPEIVRTLVVNEPDHAPWLLDSAEGRLALQEYLDRVDKPVTELVEIGALPSAIERFVDGVLGPGSFAAFTPTMRLVCMDNARELVAELRCAEIFYSPFTDDDVRQIGVPTLFLEGGATMPLFRIIADRFLRNVPDAEHVTIAGAPHAVHFAAPEQFGASVKSFLQRRGRPAAGSAS